MKRYLMFIALLGLGFGACKEDSVATNEQLQEEKINKRADATTPQEMIVFEQKVNACADTYLEETKNDPNDQAAGARFKRCLSKIPVVPTGPTDDPYPPNHGSPAATEEISGYDTPKTLNQLSAFSGATTTTTTQDSVNKFIARYNKVDSIIRNADPSFPLSKDLRKQLAYAFSNGKYNYIFTIVHGVAYPNQGMAYLLSYNAGTLKIPAHWPNYGFNLIAEYDISLSL